MSRDGHLGQAEFREHGLEHAAVGLRRHCRIELLAHQIVARAAARLDQPTGFVEHARRRNGSHAFRLLQSARAAGQPIRRGPPACAAGGAADIDVGGIAVEILVRRPEQGNRACVHGVRQMDQAEIGIDVQNGVLDDPGRVLQRGPADQAVCPPPGSAGFSGTELNDRDLRECCLEPCYERGPVLDWPALGRASRRHRLGGVEPVMDGDVIGHPAADQPHRGLTRRRVGGEESCRPLGCGQAAEKAEIGEYRAVVRHRHAAPQPVEMRARSNRPRYCSNRSAAVRMRSAAPGLRRSSFAQSGTW